MSTENNQSLEALRIEQEQKTARTRMVCNTVVAVVLILASTGVAISGQWCRFARERRH